LLRTLRGRLPGARPRVHLARTARVGRADRAARQVRSDRGLPGVGAAAWRGARAPAGHAQPAVSLSVSVVTPTLNADRYLPERLASLRAQGETPIEHLVVDGGSTDRTLDLVRANGVSVCVERPGLNQSAAINAGLRAATGEVVAWLNADDAYAAGALPRVVDHFATDPGLDALIGDCAVIGPSGESLWCQRPGQYDFDRLL